VDTRSKIVPRERFAQLIKTGHWMVVAGLFDPLTAIEAKRLAAFRKDDRKLAAIVLRDPNALFDDEARATLVASLRDVHAVTVSDPENWRHLIPAATRVEIVYDPAGEKARSAEFVQLVLTRSDAQ
jgi:hypothetical protein